MPTLGIDDGTNSVRAPVVRCADGAELGSAVFNYPSGSQGMKRGLAAIGSATAAARQGGGGGG